MQCVIDESHPHPPHIHSLTQEHRNAKQERESTGERKKNVEQERGNAEREGKIEERGHAGTQRSTGTRAHLWLIPICNALNKTPIASNKPDPYFSAHTRLPFSMPISFQGSDNVSLRPRSNSCFSILPFAADSHAKVKAFYINLHRVIRFFSVV